MAGPDVRARERFAATGAADASVEGAILASWIRSRLCGAGPDRREARYDASAVDADSRLRRAARPVLERLSADLTDTPTALLLSDPDARVLRRWASEPAMAQLMDSVRAAEGFVLSEDTVGTNGVGTPLEEGRPVAVIGTAHYNEIFDAASCAGAPVRHPVTGRVEGVVSLTCRADAANPLQLPLTSAAARDIEQRLLEAAEATERCLLAAFTAARHRTTRPVLCVGEDLVLADAGRRSDARGRIARAAVGARRGAVVDDGERLFALAIDGEEELLARCRAVRDDDAMVGVIVAIDPPRRAARRPPPRATTLAGRSAAWRAAASAVANCIATGTPVLVWANRALGRPRCWPTSARRTRSPRPRRTRPQPTASAPARSRSHRCAPARRTSARSRPRSSATAACAPRPCSRSSGCPGLATSASRDRAACDQRAAVIGVGDLPPELRALAARVPTTGLQRLEAEAIARALAGCGGNKLEAARAWGSWGRPSIASCALTAWISSAARSELQLRH